jgi:O-antigen/teichoic acid export membrane protein
VLALRTVGIVVALSEGWGLLALAGVHAVCGLLEMLWFLRLAFKVQPGLRFAPRLAERDAVRGLLRFGGWAMVVMVALKITWATDPLVIGRAQSDASVALFAIGYKLAAYSRTFLRTAVRVVEPAAGALDAVGDLQGLLRMLTGGVRWMLLLAGPVLAYLLAVGEPFLGRWMGEAYRETSGPVLQVMALAVLPAIGSFPLVSLHYGTNRMRPLAILAITEAAANLALSIVLVGPYGIVGVAWGTAVPAYIVHFGLLPWIVCRRYGLSWPRFVVRTWTGPVIAGVATWAVLRVLVQPSDVLGWPLLLGLAATSVLVYAVAVVALRTVARPLLDGPLLPRRPGPGEDDA